MHDDSTDLSTETVNQIMKDGHFPEDPGLYLDSDIKSFFDELLSRSSLRKSDVIREANIARQYGYQILEGSRIAERDYYLRIAIAMQLDFRSTQRLLAVTQAGGLHSLIKRDAAIKYAIEHRYNNAEVYEFLTKLGLPPLEKDDMDMEPE